MAKDKTGNKGPTANTGAAGGSRGQPKGGAPPSQPSGHGGHGRGGTSKPTSTPSNPSSAEMPSAPEGTRILKNRDGTSLVVDKEGTILCKIPAPGAATSSAPDQFADAEGFRPPSGQIRAAKRAATRKAREESNPDFFSRGGTHELWVLANQTRQPARQASSRPAPSASGAQGDSGTGRNDNKRKRQANVTPTGATPPAKTSKATHLPPPPKAGGYAEAAKNHEARKREAQKSRAQEQQPHALFVHLGKIDRGLMNKATYDKFRLELSKRVLANASQQDPTELRIEYTLYSAKKHAGVLACLDARTAIWFKEVVDTIELENGVSFRAWEVAPPVVGKATFNAKGLNVTPEQALVLIKAYNKDLGDGVTLARPEPIIARVTGDPIIEVVFTDNAAAILATRQPCWRLHLGTDLRLVKYYGKMELLRRLKEADHGLAEQFRQTSLNNDDDVGENVMDMLEEMDEDRAAAADGLFGNSSPDISSPSP